DYVDWTLSPACRAARNHAHEQRGDRPNSRIVECSNCTALRTAGKPCGDCGFMPETRPGYVITTDGELGLVNRERRVDPRAWTHEERSTSTGSWSPSLGNAASSRDGRRINSGRSLALGRAGG